MKRQAGGGARRKIQQGHVEASSTITYLACRPGVQYVVTLQHCRDSGQASANEHGPEGQPQTDHPFAACDRHGRWYDHRGIHLRAAFRDHETSAVYFRRPTRVAHLRRAYAHWRLGMCGTGIDLHPSRRRLHLLEGGIRTTGRVLVGMGHVLDHALRHHCRRWRRLRTIHFLLRADGRRRNQGRCDQRYPYPVGDKLYGSETGEHATGGLHPGKAHRNSGHHRFGIRSRVPVAGALRGISIRL